MGKKLHLIKPLLAAMTEYTRSYTNMGSDYSVTDLIKPPRVFQLHKRYKAQIDARPLEIKKILASFKGNAIHNQFERMLWKYMSRHPDSGMLIERRLWDRICGRKISGKFDCYLDNVLYDFKTTSTWKKIFGQTTEWELQLNIYALLLRAIGIQVDSLVVIAWYMDWDKHKVYDRGYPKDEVEAIPINNLWSFEEQKRFLKECIEYHKANEEVNDDDLSECTAEDMWQKDTTYAVYKTDGSGELPKKAARVLNSMDEADEWIEAKGTKDTYETIIRPGGRPRCDDWCKANVYCNQYKDYKESTA